MPFPTGRRSAVQGEGSSGWRKPRTKSSQPIHRRGGSLSQINILVKHYTLGESWSKPFHGFRFTLGQGWLCLTGLFSSTILLWTCLDFIYRSLFLQDCDRESASNTAMAGYSLTGSVASSYLGHQRLEVSCFWKYKQSFLSVKVGADIHTRKKFSFSSERLSETVSLRLVGLFDLILKMGWFCDAQGSLFFI